MQVSVTVITKNEASILRRMLESVRWAPEIIVVDSGSTDGTVEIAKEFTSRVISRPFVDFASQKNFAQSQASQDWVLNLDADEICSSELAQEILSLPETDINGYHISRRNFFEDRWIKHCGWSPDYKLRLYRKSAGSWKGKVHESVGLNPGSKTGRLQGRMEHYTYRNRHNYLKSVHQFARLAAEQMKEEGRSAGILDVIIRPPLAFMKKYVGQLGFLDGLAGISIAKLSFYAVYCRYSYLYQMRNAGAPASAVASNDENPTY